MEAAHSLNSAGSNAFKSVNNLLDQALADQVFPGAVMVVGKDGQAIYQRACGLRAYQLSDQKLDDQDGQATHAPAAMEFSTVFDIAGLSASIVTTTLLMKLVEQQRIRLSDRVSHYIQGFGVLGKSPITVEQLLSHTAGLIAWHPFFEDLLRENSSIRMGILTSRGAREYVNNSINRSELKYAPGTKHIYSDVGFMLLGFLVEALTGLSIDRAAQRYLIQPLGLKSTSFIDLSMIKRRGIHPVTDLIAPTEACPWRKRVLCGEVHDDNAWAMGGIAGHAGLFSAASDLHKYATEMLFASQGRSQFLKAETVNAFWQRSFSTDDGSESTAINRSVGWKNGWDSISRENGMLESGLSEKAVGNSGFTGCSMWIDPERSLSIILLSNRVHPTRANKKIVAFRPLLHKAVIEALAGS